jgi:ATP-dependent Clp protease ATP-binding subunit ClpC
VENRGEPSSGNPSGGNRNNRAGGTSSDGKNANGNGRDGDGDDVQMTFEAAGEERKADRTAQRKSILEHFGRDLTRLAEQNRLAPHVGREQELQIVIRTLSRQTKPNPLIIGEPGTGKTALVEGLAQRIAAGKVPPQLKNLRIIELSLGAIVAGTQYRGEFEKRLEMILAEAAGRPEVVLFLDEFHQAIGAGAAGGTMDAANLLKPALARGEFKCIAATTLREFGKHIEPDAALLRRFQPIVLNQPDDAATLEILRGLRARLEKHHGLTIDDEALAAAVKLSGRYESDRRQPDKAIDLLDDACTRVALHSVEHERTSAAAERRVVAEHVAEAVADRTGIPTANLGVDELRQLSNLKDALSKAVQGQDEAVAAVARSLHEIRLGLREENRPQAVFLFTGPTGVGKTALAEALAKEFFGRTEALVRIDMSEYLEPHNVSRLIGAPPGYVGHDEQGQLTRALRTRPFSLVLLDEIEKAHPRVCDVFLQVFGSGRLTDAHGEVIDCRQAMFVMTSNLGAEAYGREGNFGFPTAKDPRAATADRIEAVHEACRKQFRAEFLNRLDRIVCFNPMTAAVMRGILDRQIEQMVDTLAGRGVILEVPDEARDEFVRLAGTEQGVPPLKRLLRERILNRVAELMVRESMPDVLHVRATPAELTVVAEQ